MLRTIHVIPCATHVVIKPQPNGNLIVRLTAPPSDNKANKQLIKVLSDYFDIPRTKLRIIRGEKSRYKTIEFPD
jgi:uncharacterized protein (TIGR00251 family)